MRFRIVLAALALAITVSCSSAPTHVHVATPVQHVSIADPDKKAELIGRLTPEEAKATYLYAAQATAPPVVVAPPPPTSTIVTEPAEAQSEPVAPDPEPVATPETEPAPQPTGGSVEGAISQYFGDIYDQAWGVSGCESGHDPSAVSPGGGNWGLFQINTAHKGLVRSMGYSWDQILDPYVNAAVARRVYDNAGGWGPWSCRWAA